MNDWFATRALSPGVYLVSEPVHVNSYLVDGSDQAVLIDTGLGIGNIRTVVDALVDHEVTVLNTHYHFDHTGGNHRFDKRLIHELGARKTNSRVAPELTRNYLRFIDELLAAYPHFRELDDRYFHFLTSEVRPRALPNEVADGDWEYVPTVPTGTLRDGQVLDLGGRSLTVVHTPGHTPDCVCYLDEKEGILFGGDTINSGPIYAQMSDSDVEAFARSTRRLADLASSIRVVYVAHFERYAVDSHFLIEVADGFEQLASGTAALTPAEDYLGYPTLEASFERFSIFVASGDGPTTL